MPTNLVNILPYCMPGPLLRDARMNNTLSLPSSQIRVGAGSRQNCEPIFTARLCIKPGLNYEHGIVEAHMRR